MDEPREIEFHSLSTPQLPSSRNSLLQDKNPISLVPAVLVDGRQLYAKSTMLLEMLINYTLFIGNTMLSSYCSWESRGSEDVNS